MASGYLVVARLLALLAVVSGGPYGNVGCKFSPVCSSNEICRNDNLFGSCVAANSAYSPSFDLDSEGLQNVKVGIKYLLNEGYEWRDTFSQDFLKDILIPYQSEYLDPEVTFVRNPPLSESKKPRNGIDTYPYQFSQDVDQDGPWRNDKSLFRSKKYAFIDDAENERRRKSQDSLSDLLSEYLVLAQEIELQREEEITQQLKEYDERYKTLLNRYKSYKDAAQTTYQNKEEYYPYSADKAIQGEIQKVENLLQNYYNPDGTFVDGAWTGMEDRQGGESSSAQSSYVPLQEDSVMTSPSSKEMWMSLPAFSSEGAVSMETDDTQQGADEDVFQIVSEQLIPYLSDEDQVEWNKLNDREKESLLTLALQAVGVLPWPQEDHAESSSNPPLSEGDMKEESDSSETRDPFKGIDMDGDISWDEMKKEKKAPEEINLAVSPEDNQRDLFLNGEFGNVEKKAAVTVSLAEQGESTHPPEAPSKQPETPHTTHPAPGYAFISFHQKIDEETALLLLGELSQSLGLDPSTFSDVKIKGKQVTFLVNPNDMKMTAGDVATGAAEHGKSLGLMMGVRVDATGVGKQTEVEIQDSSADDNIPLVILTIILVACVLGILCGVVTIYCFRRKSQLQRKLKGLSETQDKETEARADYQDLCRQRMATKNSDKPEPLSRISSIAQSEGAQPSPSSRSSTSSWSEEPVQSNMDISTGHVVLSYMEDHLKNRDRLSKEWEAMCTYEPDSTSTKVGEEPRNASKNRFRHALPYDHARIILNESTNASGCDYINASAVLDSDPKALAYIATQAPMPNTLGDFWQMVWEQGSVVIVNLTHLSETELLQTPYWPNKGSAIYHIYELHLVSEHVWCADYLVRSFYLKNLETQETRTVTQFHFLSWTKDGVPGSPKALLEFRRKVNKSFRGKACPIIVHCNDGIGRTGTYCLIDLVLTRMAKGAKEIDIAATLEHVRDHRPNLVNTKEQFEFALTAVAEEVNAILKALPQ